MEKSRKCVNKEGLIKISLSGMLLILSIIVSIISRDIVIFFAMLLSSLGDICIMLSRGVFLNKKYKSFEKGIVTFAMAHLFYATIMFKKKLGIIIVVIALLTFIMTCVWTIAEGKKIRNILSIMYAICILLNFVMAVNYNWLTAVGLGFFIVSDSILAIKEDKEQKWQIPIWITYVIAQTCILISFSIT